MATLQIRPRDPSQAVSTRVSVLLCDVNGDRVDGYITASSGMVIAPYTGATSASGSLDLDLTPNADITPSSTGYKLTVSGRSAIITKSSGTQTVYQALATQPGALGPIVGATGATGATGASGAGVPTGGSTGYVLAKNSATDYDTGWILAGGTGTVTNVSGTAPIVSSGGATPAISISTTLGFGFTATDYAAGTKSSGTFTPDPTLGNFQTATNGGAHTLAPPSSSCTLILQYTNNASAGAITTSGFTKVDGDALTTTDGHDFFLYITKLATFSALTVKALQ